MTDNYRWLARFGEIETTPTGFIFKGGETKAPDGTPGLKFCNVLSNAHLAQGSASARFRFEGCEQFPIAYLIVRDNPETGSFMTAGIGGPSAFSVRGFTGSRWLSVQEIGEPTSLKVSQQYEVSANLIGDRLRLLIDGIEILRTTVPGSMPRSNVGIWCQADGNVIVEDVRVQSTQPTAFVVMQFSQPYNELHSEVIVPVCNELGIKTVRADEMLGPGLIIQDVITSLIESSIIIAEITPKNPNVFFEVGYAFALKKPMVFIAKRGETLPFDISGFRTLFYEDSIAGKARIEHELRSNLRAILAQVGLNPDLSAGAAPAAGTSVQGQ